jgi:hypothetical protein
MKYQQYIHSNAPIWVSAVLLSLMLLLPVLVIVFEGYHDGVPYCILFAFQMAIFVPGIGLIRPLVFYIWSGICFLSNVLGLAMIYYYWTSAPDWMDAEIPDAIRAAIHMSIWLNQIAIFVLGTYGWFRHFRRRKKLEGERNQEWAK